MYKTKGDHHRRCQTKILLKLYRLDNRLCRRYVGSFGRDLSALVGANGDMCENDTASFDPIFFFYHCFIDLVF